STDSAADTVNTTISPPWNGPCSRLGKNDCPVSAAWLAAGSADSAPVGASRCWIGFTPSTEANSEETGGKVATWCATAAGTPCWVSPRDKADGSAPDSPAIISVNTTPIDTAVPEFWNVARMPEAAPRSRAGTLPMIEEELGEANIPEPIPFTATSSANAQDGKFTGSSISPTKLSANTAIPAVAIPRDPNLSDRMPDVGPDTRKPAVIGSRKMPAHSGVCS